MTGVIPISKIALILLFIVLYLWWIWERKRQIGRQLGTLQIFMPFVMIAPIITDNKLVWLFGILFSILGEGIYLMIQGTSEISWQTIHMYSPNVSYNTSDILRQTRKILQTQITFIWIYILLVLLSAFISIPHIDKLFFILYALYGSTWLILGVIIRKLHPAGGLLMIIGSILITIFLIIGNLFNSPFIGIIGAITTFGLVSYVGTTIESIFRAYAKVLEFDRYMDISMALILFYIVIGSIIPWNIVYTYLRQFETLTYTAIPIVVKLLFAATLMTFASRTVANIKYVLDHKKQTYITYNMK